WATLAMKSWEIIAKVYLEFLHTLGRGVLTGFLQTQRRGFFGKQTFEAFGASKEKFVAIRHVYSRA
ncbi:hypothetical protein A260_05877, partial [Pseudomonas syringae pv. actinidiae ICMP 19068]